ncbi:MAG: type 1 glutamine amidotransferase [Bdellovibrionaceae bacterium]|nr:type 1 glutamine amidotransferase [Pseudobdellovibrionaceae bacterium]
MAWNEKSAKSLKGKRIAIVATNGFEESELFEPLKALRDADADVEIISPKAGKIRAWKDNDWGSSIAVDRVVQEATPEDYDGLVLPGGVINSDKLRGEADVVSFVKSIAENGTPIAAICHAAWTLIETGCVSGHEMTSWPSLKTDLQNAGANWVDREVVTDHGWVTSRKPDDLPAFNQKMIEEFGEGKHPPQRSTSIGESLNVGRL